MLRSPMIRDHEGITPWSRSDVNFFAAIKAKRHKQKLSRKFKRNKRKQLKAVCKRDGMPFRKMWTQFKEQYK